MLVDPWERALRCKSLWDFVFARVQGGGWGRYADWPHELKVSGDMGAAECMGCCTIWVYLDAVFGQAMTYLGMKDYRNAVASIENGRILHLLVCNHWDTLSPLVFCHLCCPM
jgi:hypothetical protein